MSPKRKAAGQPFHPPPPRRQRLSRPTPASRVPTTLVSDSDSSSCEQRILSSTPDNFSSGHSSSEPSNLESGDERRRHSNVEAGPFGKAPSTTAERPASNDDSANSSMVHGAKFRNTHASSLEGGYAARRTERKASINRVADLSGRKADNFILVEAESLGDETDSTAKSEADSLVEEIDRVTKVQIAADDEGYRTAAAATTPGTRFHNISASAFANIYAASMTEQKRLRDAANGLSLKRKDSATKFEAVSSANETVSDTGSDDWVTDESSKLHESDGSVDWLGKGTLQLFELAPSPAAPVQTTNRCSGCTQLSTRCICLDTSLATAEEVAAGLPAGTRWINLPTSFRGQFRDYTSGKVEYLSG